MDVLINFDLRSDSKRQDAGALLDMLEFGFHCFITPSENINDVTRMSVLNVARYVICLLWIQQKTSSGVLLTRC